MWALLRLPLQAVTETPLKVPRIPAKTPIPDNTSATAHCSVNRSMPRAGCPTSHAPRHSSRARQLPSPPAGQDSKTAHATSKPRDVARRNISMPDHVGAHHTRPPQSSRALGASMLHGRCEVQMAAAFVLPKVDAFTALIHPPLSTAGRAAGMGRTWEGLRLHEPGVHRGTPRGQATLRPKHDGLFDSFRDAWIGRR